MISAMEPDEWNGFAVCRNDVSSAGDPAGAIPGGYAVNIPGPASLVFIVSADAAVRRALALLLETEGIGSRSFASAPTLLAELPSLMGKFAGAHHCLLVEDRLADGGNGLELAERLAASGFPMPAVVLSMPARLVAAGRAALPHNGIVFADPFQADAILRHVREALGLPDSGLPA